MNLDDVRARLREHPALARDLESFTPWDNIPWQRQASQLLRCRFEGGFLGLRPPHRTAAEASTLVRLLGVQPPAKLLDLGCGPGIHAHLLGTRGYSVTGVDIAAPLLEHARREARAHAWPCRFLQRSFLALDFGPEFDGGFAINSPVNQLVRREIVALLEGVRAALVPGATFVLELQVRPRRWREDAERRRLFRLPFSPWSPEPHVWLERILSFPEDGQRVTQHVILHGDGSIEEYWSRSRLHDFTEFADLLATCGFGVLAALDRDLKTQMHDDSDKVWLVTRREPT